jgi:predicted permease
MNRLIQDFKYAIRMLFKRPLSTLILVVSLGLGIGANTLVISWMQNTLLHPLQGVADQERLVVLCSSQGSTIWETVSYPDIKDYAGLNQVFTGVIGSQVTPACLRLDGQIEWIYGQIATTNFFDVLGVKPTLGRGFLPEEELKPGGAPVLVISHGFWQRRFGSDPGVIGKTVELNKHVFTIVGIAPPTFQGTMGALRCDFWAPITMHNEVANFGSLTVRNDRWLHTQARLQPGVTRQQAQAAATLMAKQLADTYPNQNREISLRLFPLWRCPYGGPSVLLPVLSILLAVCLGVLAMVAVNVANLLLVWATTRQKEFAIRLAVGAARQQIIRQLLTENLLLALMGGAIGVGLAQLGANLLLFFIPPSYLPIHFALGLHWETMAATLVLSIITGLGFGMVPAFKSTQAGLNDALKEGGRSSSSAHTHHRMRNLLVTVEIAMAVLLLVVAGLCFKGFQKAQLIDPGFNPDQVLISGLRIGMNGYDETKGMVFYRHLHERLSQTAGIKAAALGSWFPLGFEGGPSLGVRAEGYQPAPNENTSIPYTIVSPDFFSTMKIPLLEGRDFTDQDDRTRPRVAIINEQMAKRFWPQGSPVGRKYRARGQDYTIIGICKTGKYKSLDEAPRGMMYLAYQQGVWDLNLGIVVRTEGRPQSFAPAVRAAIHELDPAVEIWATMAYTEYMQPAYFIGRIAATLLSILGTVALLLATMGIYGVMAYSVSQRTHEIGLRMALGAQIRDVYQLVLGGGMKLTLAGISSGIVAAVLTVRGLAAVLYGVSPFDLTIFTSACIILATVAFLASYLPARRASQVNPMVALRHE